MSGSSRSPRVSSNRESRCRDSEDLVKPDIVPNLNNILGRRAVGGTWCRDRECKSLRVLIHLLRFQGNTVTLRLVWFPVFLE